MPVAQEDRRNVLMEGTPALVTNLPAMQLDEDQSPSVSGISATAEGFLTKGSIPSGTARTVKLFGAYEWHFNRLWRIDNTGTTPVVRYGAPDYTATYYRQHTGDIEMYHSTANALKIMPFGNSMAIFKSDGGYVINGANSQAGGWEAGDFQQEMNISTATHCVELDGTIYFINGDGLFALKQDGSTEEVSFAVRGNSAITAAALTVDYDRKFVVIGTTAVYDVNLKRFYDYSTAFAFTSRRVTDRTNKPFLVSGVTFVYDVTNTNNGTITFEMQVEERGWSNSQTVTVKPEQREDNESYFTKLQGREKGRSFQLRISDMSSNIKIKRIYIPKKDFTQQSMDS